MAKKRLLFVCLGNICRSPSAEAVMKDRLAVRGFEEKYIVDSAGIIDHHAGEQADPRMKTHASKRGINLASIARQVREQDFQNFDYLFAMDKRNFRDLQELAPSEEHKQKIHMMTAFCRQEKNKNLGEVPDPYFGGDEGFELVLNLLEDACEGLIEELETKGSL